VSESEDLLRRLAKGDERSLQAVLSLRPELEDAQEPIGSALDRRSRVLVRLGALAVIGASTTSLRWAVDLAATSGVDEQAILGALLAAASAAGSAQVVSSASNLAVALGFDFEGGDGS
jgi:alkylhydroperoxidase/carboxymuconolactone decarboxylase family protein YurZ